MKRTQSVSSGETRWTRGPAHENWEWGKIAAGGTCVMLPVLILAFVVRKYLVAGLSAGAVKG